MGAIMETLKYKIITSEKQYDGYCKTLENLVFEKTKNKAIKEEIALLTLLVEKWDSEHNIFDDLDPVGVLKAVMKEHKMKSAGLAKMLKVSPGLVSDIINYKKGFSKEIIRQLAAFFKLSHEAFNRPYQLKTPINNHLKNASVMNTKKKLKAA